jgi:hypothetical protein
MRDIGSYSTREWLTAVPVVHRVKHLRNRALERTYRSLGARERDRFLAESAGALGRKLVLTIAFNTPWAVDLFIRTARRNLHDVSVVVADNSSNAHASAEIGAVCARYHAAFLRVPKNPDWHPNRSHAIAMNWVYHNLVRPLDPEVFAFLDHDLFALSPFDIAESVARQPVFGFKKQHPGQEAWSLWAGHCIFNKAAIQGRTLDFGYDLPLRLDTGGYNWGRLYRFLDGDEMAFAEGRIASLRDPVDGSLHLCGLIDSFVHFQAASYGSQGNSADRTAFFRRLIAHVETGGRWEELVVRQAPSTAILRMNQKAPWESAEQTSNR